MRAFHRLGVATAVAIGLAGAAIPASAQDCDAMAGEIDQLLQTANITEEQRQQVLDLRDQAMGDQAGRAGGDCTDTLQQALDILKGNN